MDLKEIDSLELQLENELRQIKNADDLEKFRVKYLARKGELNDFFEKLKTLEVNDKRIFGPRLNELKKNIENVFNQIKNSFSNDNKDSFFDYTIPGIKKEIGSLHPITLMTRHMLKVFDSFGFEIMEAGEIESEYYNFDSLNVEKDHPARDAWDTF
jgi:phenylalanyl-tRNA synthetase alpha chain